MYDPQIYFALAFKNKDFKTILVTWVVRVIYLI